jgi:ubiquitin C-terminal hydrolase
MSLIPYNPSLELYPNGFNNLGSTCYFNALLQSILSCTSFTETVVQYPSTTNPVITLISQLIKTNLENNSNNSNLCKYAPHIWKQMIIKLCKNKKIPVQDFMQGQQCAGEGFHYLLESMEKFQGIQNLFLHRYKSLIRCFKCDKWVSDVECMYSLFEIDPNFKSEQLSKFKQYHKESSNMHEFLSKQSSYVEDFKCPKCKNIDAKYQVNMLVMVPEILVVMAKKYNKTQKLDIHTDFPKKLEFDGNDAVIKYEAVAQIEHSGIKNGGHYWAICKRKTGWFALNDMSVTPSKFQPTKNTYIVFYHLK